MNLLSQNKAFGGLHQRFEHHSSALKCTMKFAVFLPPQALVNGEISQQKSFNVPSLYWLSGLTCTDENFMQKAGAMKIAAELGIAIIAPDTSPRGDGVPDDENASYDMGLGAGFYVNATQAPWREHYQMYDYVVTELPKLIEASLPVSAKRAISGHSMGGHGALTIGLKNTDNYSSISAFSPIANPVNCPWGEKALTAYLGSDRSTWASYDSAQLLANYPKNATKLPILVDQGKADDFLDVQLKPEALTEAAKSANYPLQLRLHEGYDHSYFFIATFIDEHLRFHHQHLNADMSS